MSKPTPPAAPIPVVVKTAWAKERATLKLNQVLDNLYQADVANATDRVDTLTLSLAETKNRLAAAKAHLAKLKAGKLPPREDWSVRDTRLALAQLEAVGCDTINLNDFPSVIRSVQ